MAVVFTEDYDTRSTTVDTNITLRIPNGDYYRVTLETKTPPAGAGDAEKFFSELARRMSVTHGISIGFMRLGYVGDIDATGTPVKQGIAYKIMIGSQPTDIVIVKLDDWGFTYTKTWLLKRLDQLEQEILDWDTING